MKTKAIIPIMIIAMLVGFAVPLTDPAAPKPIPIKARVGNSIQKRKQSVERGIASWYGEPFNEQLASDGEIYDMYELTAAHPTLPFGSIVRVTNLRNGKQVEVRVIDRGLFVAGRVIDLSLAGAEAIGMVDSGLARVKVEIVSRGPHDR